MGLEGEGGGKGESGVGDTAEEVVLEGVEEVEEVVGDLSKDGWVRDCETEIDVVGRLETGFESKVAELYGTDFVEGESEVARGWCGRWGRHFWKGGR